MRSDRERRGKLSMRQRAAAQRAAEVLRRPLHGPTGKVTGQHGPWPEKRLWRTTLALWLHALRCRQLALRAGQAVRDATLPSDDSFVGVRDVN